MATDSGRGIGVLDVLDAQVNAHRWLKRNIQARGDVYIEVTEQGYIVITIRNSAGTYEEAGYGKTLNEALVKAYLFAFGDALVSLGVPTSDAWKLVNTLHGIGWDDPLPL